MVALLPLSGTEMLFFGVLAHGLKDMLEKLTMQRTQQFSAFSLLPKEPSEMQRMHSCSKNWVRLLLQKLADF